MLVEGFSQLLRDHSQTINYLQLLLFVLSFILQLLVKNRYEIVQISHEINNKKTYLKSFFLSKQSLLHKNSASVITFLRIESPSCMGPGRPAIV